MTAGKQSLLDEPNPNSPANSQAAQLYQENKREYEKRVTAIVEQSWLMNSSGSVPAHSLLVLRQTRFGFNKGHRLRQHR
ncbi:hypothetical protein CHARACLAT_008427 [Characodon lateralis]|uniref:UBC core domain-containing protein n=1 Tax=Characodon lateralis TaxID=208331 RepID=A0ABU7CVY5_9TELE|nr:hypothetical protein [Characodon lateralis]